MNAESSSFPSDDGAESGDLCGVLQEVVGQIRALAAPPDLAARFLDRAAAWSYRNLAPPTAVADRAQPAAHRTGLWVFAAVAVLGIAVTLGTFVSWLARTAPEPEAVAVVQTVVDKSNKSAPAETIKESPPVSAKNDSPAPAKTKGAVPSDGLTAGTSPVPFHAVAAEAPILVSTGGARPIRLGDKLPYDGSGTLHVWDWSKGADSRPLKVKTTKGMAVSPDGQWIVTRDGQLIDVATSAVKRLDNFDGDVHGLHFSPDGRVLLLTVNGAKDVASARVLDIPSAKKRFEIPGQWSYTFACAFTPDSARFFLMDKDKFVHRWDAQTGKELGRYEPAFTNSIRAIAVSADAKRVVAAGTRGDIHLWDLASGKLLHTLVDAKRPNLTELTDTGSLAFAPDGKLLASGGFERAALWDTDSGKVVRVLSGNSPGASYLRFSKDGKQLTTVHEFYGTSKKLGDNVLVYPTVRQWNVEDGKELKAP